LEESIYLESWFSSKTLNIWRNLMVYLEDTYIPQYLSQKRWRFLCLLFRSGWDVMSLPLLYSRHKIPPILTTLRFKWGGELCKNKRFAWGRSCVSAQPSFKGFTWHKACAHVHQWMRNCKIRMTKHEIPMKFGISLACSGRQLLLACWP